MNAWGLSATRGTRLPDLELLDDRQRAVLRCLARGLADHEIAGVLQLTSRQVGGEVAEILRRLNLRDRISAVVFAHEAGMIRMPLPLPR
ncbi:MULTISPECIES: response regulator transcription factor [Actinosynnema]|uniref:response regulator transcription factor n=1 Tax=Actinosynnema TaxID=40566 RepID=UPI0020A30137|nr:LuxR C-terminal-related transcriptional regulator [Actinosynnema pretiosum]MCP2093525.1 regulatory protein, luxR family [Actinosynnema pretiosum]